MRVALAHDYLTQRGGAERVVLALHRAFPTSPIYTTLYSPEGTYPEFSAADLRLSWLDRIPLFRRDHRLALPLLGRATRSLRVTDADVVLCSTTAFMHGISSDVPKLVYCHSPGRFIYLVDEYLGRPWYRSPLGWGLRALNPFLRRWDQAAARTAARYVCNSRVVADRIRRVYGIDADVVPPPHSIDTSGEQTKPTELTDWGDGFFLVVSRLLPYKNISAVLAAFADQPDQRLVVIGRGPLESELRGQLKTNTRLLAGVTDAELRWAYAHATALIAPSYEDFGLTPLEAASFGTPTLALEAGGYLDTMAPGVNGAFFATPTAADIGRAVREHDRSRYDTAAIQAHADRFSEERFAARIRGLLRDLVGER